MLWFVANCRQPCIAYLQDIGSSIYLHVRLAIGCTYQLMATRSVTRYQPLINLVESIIVTYPIKSRSQTIPVLILAYIVWRTRPHIAKVHL
jgi:hypothetical protein